MHSQQHLWTFLLFGSSYNVSPYILINGVAFILGILFLDHRLTKLLPEEAHNKIYKIFILSIVSGWVGAHLFDGVVRDLSFLQAGFTFYGGILFGFLIYTLLFFLLCSNKIFISTLNIAVAPLVISHAIGRLGCYFAGCCYGKILQHDHFLNNFFIRHPTQLYESLYLFIIFIFLVFHGKYRGIENDVYFYVYFYCAFRFFIEFLRGDDRGFWLGMSTSQWVSATLLFMATIFLIVKSNKKHLTLRIVLT